ncbi:MAG TPA: Hsp20/alpha crystallin family protein [Negativicutes bacterium]|jgi:HSP20 family molecular chaperone IbpA
MATNSLAERNENRSVGTREDTRSSERYIRPAVNIVENEEGLMLTADIPGASRESLEVNVEKGILTISAQASRTMPGTPVYTEFELAPYYRQFSVPEILDQAKAIANFTNGILTLRIPKAEMAKPRKIEVKVA